jgi:hypothetical protein
LLWSCSMNFSKKATVLAQAFLSSSLQTLHN